MPVPRTVAAASSTPTAAARKPIHTNTRRPLAPVSEEVKVKPHFLDDSSEGVEDFREWSYFQKNKTRVRILGHTSAWSAAFVDKVRSQRFYDMDAPLVVRKKKTPLELQKEQEERQRRAKLQLMKWMESGAEKEKDKTRKGKTKSKGATFVQKVIIARSMGRLMDSDSDLDRSTHSKHGSGSDSETDLNRSRHGTQLPPVARRKESVMAALSDASMKEK